MLDREQDRGIRLFVVASQYQCPPLMLPVRYSYFASRPPRLRLCSCGHHSHSGGSRCILVALDIV